MLKIMRDGVTLLYLILMDSYERDDFKSSSSKLCSYDDDASVHIVCRFGLYLWSSINDISIRVNTYKD